MSTIETNDDAEKNEITEKNESISGSASGTTSQAAHRSGTTSQASVCTDETGHPTFSRNQSTTDNGATEPTISKASSRKSSANSKKSGRGSGLRRESEASADSVESQVRIHASLM